MGWEVSLLQKIQSIRFREQKLLLRKSIVAWRIAFPVCLKSLRFVFYALLQVRRYNIQFKPYSSIGL